MSTLWLWFYLQRMQSMYQRKCESKIFKALRSTFVQRKLEATMFGKCQVDLCQVDNRTEMCKHHHQSLLTKKDCIPQYKCKDCYEKTNNIQ